METTDQHVTERAVEALKRTPKRTAMTRHDFFAEVVTGLRAFLPEAYRDFRHRSNPLLLKVDYGNPRVHYEVWCDSEKEILGIGLHFEDGPVSTEAYLAFFDQHILEIKHILGTEVELERWTASWGHLYEHRALEQLSEDLANLIAARLGEMIKLLQPLVEAAGVAPERSAEPVEGRRGPWRRFARR